MVSNGTFTADNTSEEMMSPAPGTPAAPIALGATAEHLRAHPDAHDEVRFVLFGTDAVAAFGAALGQLAAG